MAEVAAGILRLSSSTSLFSPSYNLSSASIFPKGNLVLQSSHNVRGSGKDQIHLVGLNVGSLTLHYKRLIPRLEPVTSSHMTATPTVASKFPFSPSSAFPAKKILHLPVSRPTFHQNESHLSHSTVLYVTLNSPRGFGTPPRRSKKAKKTKPGNDDDDNVKDDEQDEPDAGVIPEVVTNRMMTRMGVSVGGPLFIGLLFFPFFYYLKVGLKIDVPTWMPFIVSFFFFGSALLGVSYGIMSSSWDPMREGSFWGWNEAQKNWPVFWQSLRGRPGKK